MAFTVENIRRDEVMLALGEDADSAVPEQVRSRLSGRSVLDIGDQIDGLADLYFGFGGDPGLSDYASARGYDFDRDVRRALDAVRMALDALEPSLEVAITSERAVVEQLQMSLRDLQILIQVDIVGALGLTQNFNDNDGD
jgi:predicted lipoprotein